MTEKEKQERAKKRWLELWLLLFAFWINTTNAIADYVALFGAWDSGLSVSDEEKAATLVALMALTKDAFEGACTEAWGSSGWMLEEEFLQDVATQVESQEKYWSGFLDKVAEYHYTQDDGSVDVKSIEARTKLYAMRVRGMANQAWVYEQGLRAVKPQIMWMLGDPATAHCEQCPELAAGGPYEA